MAGMTAAALSDFSLNQSLGALELFPLYRGGARRGPSFQGSALTFPKNTRGLAACFFDGSAVAGQLPVAERRAYGLWVAGSSGLSFPGSTGPNFFWRWRSRWRAGLGGDGRMNPL